MGNKPDKQAVKQTPVQSPRGGGGGGGGGGNALIASAQVMKTTVDNLEKRRKFLETKAKREQNAAIQYKRQGNQQRALMALKRKKQIEGFMDKVDAQMYTLERQQFNLEQASTAQSVVHAMTTGLNAQRKLNKNMNVEKVEELVAESEELADDLEGVNEVLAGDAGIELDDADLMAEFNAMDNEQIEEQAFAGRQKEKPKETVLDLPTAPSGIHTTLPSVPTTPVKVAKQPVLEGSDEAALEALAAEML